MAKRTGFARGFPRIFSTIGKPFFWFFLFVLKTLEVLFALLSQLFSLVYKKISRIKITFPRISLPKIKIAFPKKRKTKKGKKIVLFPKKRFPAKTLSFFLGVLTAALIYRGLTVSIFRNLPSPKSLDHRQQVLTTRIYDRNGEILYKIYKEQDRTPVLLDELPLYLLQATVAIEDKDFYHHQGLSIRGIGRAVFQNLFFGKRTGGSTITQQLIKNTLLNSEKTWRRKIKEAVLAVLVEKKYTKNQILEMYLNEVGYGGSAYGIEEAAEKYFAKHASELTIPEAALLAGLTASPTRYSPFGIHPELAKERQKLVLQRMVEDGYLTQEEKQVASQAKLIYAPQKTDIKAPHFVMFIKDLLVQKYGEKMVEEGGLEVTTSLDFALQEKARQIVKTEITKLGNLHITNGAALVTNPKTGEILAMVGSKDYFAEDIDGNFNVTTALRQPGSSIKPINYSIALENGFTPASLIDDSPIVYQVPGQEPYSPKNYDNRFHGKITLRTALASSYNVPAVKVLAAFGVKRMIERGKEMGITSWSDSSRYGLSLTLGGGEIRMVDLVVAYGTLANYGIRVDLNPILTVKNSEGETLEESKHGQETPVINPGVAFLLTNILSDNTARAPAFGLNSVLNIPGHSVAVKTGTTQNLRDNWTIGYAPSFLTAVWVGNNDNTPMSYVASGVTGASPIWRKIMDELLKGRPKEPFAEPEEIKEVNICQTTGTLPCEGCPSIKTEFFLSGTEPKSSCDPQVLIELTPAP